jgi:hypothetical protein
MNYEGKEKMCQQIADLVQRKVGARANNAIPLEYKDGTIQEEAKSLKYKDNRVHEETAGSQGNVADVTLGDPTPNNVVPSKGKQHQEIQMSTRKRKPPEKLSKDLL